MSTRSEVFAPETVLPAPVRRGEQPGLKGGLDLETFLVRALAEAVFGAAFVCAAVVALFGQSKPTERLGYFLVALVVVPASLALAARGSRNRPTHERDSAVIQLALTAAVIDGAKLVNPARTSALLVLGLIALRIATTVGQRYPRRPVTGHVRRSLVAIVPVALVAAAVPFVPAAALDWANIAIAVACSIALVPLVKLARRWRRSARRVLDAGTVSLCTLLVFYLGPPVKSLAVNQNYFLGPTTDVLHGHPMLVGTYSQYGYGIFDGLGAFFSIAPIGYGSFTLLVSALTAMLFAAYMSCCACRQARRSSRSPDLSSPLR
jgi:hypothetical protein